jgi:large subunit ribosomal protein L4
MAVSTYTKSGTKATTNATLNKGVFGLEVNNHELLKAAYITYLANGRDNLAVVKTRGLVRGGGRKPWSQKGTGRARFGSSRTPIWRGGGITFGPTGEENYSKKLSLKAKRQALRQSLSMAANDNKLIVIEDIISKAGKTAELSKLLAKINAGRQVLLVVEQKTPELLRASGNLPGVSLVSARFLTVYAILNADHLVFSSNALKTVTDWLSEGAKS